MILATAVAATAFAVATPALAQETFATKGDFAFAADRLTGVYLYSQGNEDRTVLGLLQTPSGVTSYHMARIGFDYFPIARLSIGGALSYWSHKIERDPTDVTVGTTKELMIAPRVGYAIPITRAFGFWPRGGITYIKHWDPDINEAAITLEAQFYASPAPHFAFIFGPVFDLGFAGTLDDRIQNIGILTGGILGWI